MLALKKQRRDKQKASQYYDTPEFADMKKQIVKKYTLEHVK